MLCTLLVAFLACCPWTQGVAPRFDPTTLMRLVLVPADAAVGAVVYRFRATDDDFDYPLHFELADAAAKGIVSVETLACTKYNSVCQANVVLRRRLEAGRFYDFRVTLRDTSGDAVTIACSMSATNATTPRDTIFPHMPGLITVAEDSKRGTDLEYVIARKNPRFTKPVYLELWGSPLFAIRQHLISNEETEGTIFLLGPLDYEKQATYHLNVLANDAYAEPGQDSRNIAGLEVVVVVVDVQDMPPVFVLAPPITQLNNTLLPGDIVTRVHAEDGDKGAPRAIRYGLVSEGNPFTLFFNISPTNGDITLARPLDDIAAISHVGVPIILTVVAEEVRLNKNEPEAMSSTVQLAFILGERDNRPPYFANDNYVARINENSPQGSTLQFSESYVPEVRDDDVGENGAFALILANNNGTFEITPNVGEQHVSFLISVRDNTLLDYEATKTVRFKIVAQELGPVGNVSTSVDVIVFLNDVNDNPPQFVQKEYSAELVENVTAGVQVVQVTATDADTGIYGRIRYTQILGHLNTSLSLDPETGAITVATNEHGFDCETKMEHRFYVEATDEDGVGNRATVPLILHLIDVNDEIPQFERSLYEFILSPSRRNFTFPAVLQADDRDVTAPNNIVRYELTHGNYGNIFALNSITGELTLRESLLNGTNEVYVLNARAYDLGVPHLSSTCQINVYPPETRIRTMLFIVAGRNPDRQRTEEMLAAITGGKVTVKEVRPYTGDDGSIGATDITSGDKSSEKSIVTATVSYGKNAIIDISQLQNKLGHNRTIIGNTNTAPGHVYPNNDLSIPYRAESNVLFWLLMFLAFLILVALITLVLCCICAGCPLYMPPKKRIVRISSTDDDVHLVMKEKGTGKDNNNRPLRREAWSADVIDSRTRPTHWQFKYDHDLRPKPMMNGHAMTSSAGALHEGPHIIYNRELQERQYHLDETESLRQHEMERGSDRVYHRDDGMRRAFHRQQAINRDFNSNNEFKDEHDDRDQLFIREGNTEILRLMTRGRQENKQNETVEQRQRPVTLVQRSPQYILVDSGKHLLMERFIEQQLLEQAKQSQHGSNSNVSSIAESKHTAVKNELLLETSLRQQNELLRQILLEKEQLDEQKRLRDEVRLETQSLPGVRSIPMATQTECTAETQTEPWLWQRPPKRQARSDNDESASDEDDFLVYVINGDGRVSEGKRLSLTRQRSRSKRYRYARIRNRHIKTPILEENESPLELDVKSPEYYETKSSDLRRKINKKNQNTTTVAEANIGNKLGYSEVETSGDVPRNVVRTQSVVDGSDTDEDYSLYYAVGSKFTELFSEDSMEYDIKKLSEDKIKRNSPMEIHKNPTKKTLTPVISTPLVEEKKKTDLSKCMPRYMQWYTKTEHKKSDGTKLEGQKQKKTARISKSLLADTKSSSLKKVYPVETKMDEITQNKTEPSSTQNDQTKTAPHPLVQHSAYRYERPSTYKYNATPPVVVSHGTPATAPSSTAQPHQIAVQPPDKPARAHTKKEKAKGVDDDFDSGIAMVSLMPNDASKRNAMTEKKSIFTIAYDDIHTKQLRPDSSTPPY